MTRTVTPAELPGLVGLDLGSSEWLRIGQDRIDRFADVTEDHQYIHVDVERAARTPFGSTIAHGFLTLSLVTCLLDEIRVHLEGAVMGVNYGLNRVRFITPVRVGSRVRAHATLRDALERSPGQYLLTYEVTIEIEDDEAPAAVAEWLVLSIVR